MTHVQILPISIGNMFSNSGNTETPNTCTSLERQCCCRFHYNECGRDIASAVINSSTLSNSVEEITWPLTCPCSCPRLSLWLYFQDTTVLFSDKHELFVTKLEGDPLCKIYSFH